jgi:hypothetical protein
MPDGHPRPEKNRPPAAPPRANGCSRPSAGRTSLSPRLRRAVRGKSVRSRGGGNRLPNSSWPGRPTAVRFKVVRQSRRVAVPINTTCVRHGRTCSGHPRARGALPIGRKRTWITGTGPVMTITGGGRRHPHNRFCRTGQPWDKPGHPRLEAVETKTWMRGSTPRKTTGIVSRKSDTSLP